MFFVSTVNSCFLGCLLLSTTGARVSCTEYGTQAHSHRGLSSTHIAYGRTSFEETARDAQKQRAEPTIHRC